MALINGTPDRDDIDGTTGDDSIYGEAGNDDIRGLGGNDFIVGGHGDDQIEGGAGNDMLVGGGGGDSIQGGEGSDTISGGAGRDTLLGDAGNDDIRGGNGSDFIVGGANDDLLMGEDDADMIYGGAGRDVLNGGAGNDTLYGGDDDDRLAGLAGRDELFGGGGTDRLAGGGDRDDLFGGADNDVLKGETGNDSLYGDSGLDRLFGGAGNDRAFGGTGNDRLIGGMGDDRLRGDDGDDVLRGGTGQDVMFGGAGADVLQGDAGGDMLHGGGGDDRLFAGNNDDLLYGDSGSDTLRGEAGGDIIHGGAGGDVLIGDLGADRLYGDAGTDNLVGGEDNDQLYGGADTDVLSGGNGDDALNGGGGGDVLFGGAGADRFIFSKALDTAPAGSGRDVIKDFVSGEDWIDVSRIDAIAATGENDAFTLVGSFTGTAGELTISALGGGNLVAGDTDGDGNADFGIFVHGDAPVEADLNLGGPAPVIDLTLLRPELGFIVQGDAALDRAGIDVAHAGDVNGDGFADIVIGASGAESGNSDYVGEAYVIFGTDQGFGTLDGSNRNVLDLTSLSAADGFVLRDSFGHTFQYDGLSSAGDINGDGLADLIIAGAASEGVYVVFGTDGGFGAPEDHDGHTRQTLDLSQMSASEGFLVMTEGRSVASAGDLNGDGFDDMVIGSPDEGGRSNAVGEAIVIFGTDQGFGEADVDPGTPERVLDDDTLSADEGFVIVGESGSAYRPQTGFSVTGAGDLNGDGFDDLVISAPDASSAIDEGALTGNVYVIFGRGTGFGETGADGRQTIDLENLAPEDGFTISSQGAARHGWSVSSAGDLNDDGFDDLLVATPYADFYQDPEVARNLGDTYVIYGSDAGFGALGGDGRQYLDLSGLAPSEGFIIRGESENDFAGYRVSEAGDVNGDSIDDIIIGAWGADAAGVEAGAAYIVFGGDAGFGSLDDQGRRVLDLGALSSSEGVIIHGDGRGDRAGYDVSAAGDLNGDGFDDVLVGAYQGDDGGTVAGEAYVIYGRSDFSGLYQGPNTPPAFTSGQTVSVPEHYAQTGYVAAASDLDHHPLDYFISGGADASKFKLEHGEWALNFRAAPDFENPSDANGDNVYEVEITATDGQDAVTRTIEFTVTDVEEAPVIDLSSLGTDEGFVIQGENDSDQFGESVALLGDVNGDGIDDIIVGAGGADHGGDYSGRAYVIFGSTSGFGSVDATGRSVIAAAALSETQGFIIQGGERSDLGASVASAGDINGDGLDDLVVGAPFGPDGSRDGEAFVIYGTGDGFRSSLNGSQVLDVAALTPSEGFVLTAGLNSEQFGTSASQIGDINGDGFDDLIVGAPFAGSAWEGRAYVVFGTDQGFGATVNGRQTMDMADLQSSDGFIVEGANWIDMTGESVSGAGDFNGDGIDDFLIGAPDAEIYGNSGVGAGFVLFGSDNGFGAIDADGSEIVSLYDLDPSRGFHIGHAGGGDSGRSVAGVGDVNNDGFDDILIGSPHDDENAYLLFGTDQTPGSPDAQDRHVVNTQFLSAAEGLVIKGAATNDEAGFSVSGAGDVNGDGLADMVIGAPAPYDADETGGAYIIFGNASGFGQPDEHGRNILDLSLLTASEGVIIQGDSGGDAAGWSVSGAGDVNDDGFDDVVIGARLGDDGATDAGEAYVIFGRADFSTGAEPASTKISLDELAKTDLSSADDAEAPLGNSASAPPPERPLTDHSRDFSAALEAQMAEIAARFGDGPDEAAAFDSLAPDGFEWF